MLRTVFLCCVVLSSTWAQECPSWTWSDTTALDQYIAADDGAYTWEIIDFYNNTQYGCDTYVVNFTSQIWQDETFSSNPVWFHYLLVHIPVEGFVNPDAAALYIEGGSQDSSPPDPEGETAVLTCRLAKAGGSAGGLLRQIPNQPISYPDDPEGRDRTEDANIAWTWKKFLEDQSDPTILLQFPMTKGAVKALDTISNVVKAVTGSDIDVDRFLPAGGSKRGWIVWLLASVDPRVVVASPMVLSILNFNKNLHAHYEQLGGWTWVFSDYYEVNLTLHLDDPATFEMMDHIDPYCYRERMTMPKLIVSATGDEFFMPDATTHFFDDLVGETWNLLAQNTNHGMVGKYLRTYEAVKAIWVYYLEDLPRPSMNWTMLHTETDASITLNTEWVPDEVICYYADTITDRCDFRWTVLNDTDVPVGQQVVWYDCSDNVTQVTPNQYYVETVAPGAPYHRGILLNARFDDIPRNVSFDFTTSANYVPASYPFPPCVGTDCWGELV